MHKLQTSKLSKYCSEWQGEMIVNAFWLPPRPLLAVCPPGTYQIGTGSSASCVSCGQAFFCPGGSREAKNSAPATDIGVRYSCHQPGNTPAADSATTASIEAFGVTTRSARSRRYTDCLPKPGYFLLVSHKVLAGNRCM